MRTDKGAERQTDMIKLTVDFRNFANSSKSRTLFDPSTSLPHKIAGPYNQYKSKIRQAMYV
jgi:hypothetical protein